MNEEKQLKLEFQHTFGEEDEPLYELKIHNNLQSSDYNFFGGQKKATCEYCNTQHNDDCELPGNKDLL